MQDKNKLDDMTKKYKDEMMRLYSKKRTVILPTESHKPITVPETASTQQNVQTVPQSATNQTAMRDFSHPPMPNVPKDYGIGTPKMIMPSNNITPKFQPADEILQQENCTIQAANISPETKFESIPVDQHEQGNYDFPPYDDDVDETIEGIIPDKQYPDTNTDFDELDNADDFPTDNPTDMKGMGYLQVEVTTGNGAIPIYGAAVIVTRQSNGMSYLVTMELTDRNGTTNVIPLPAPSASFSEAPNPSERPFSEYNISVYKKGFYTIPLITVPIFDTIKSIQPVSVIPLAEYELQGAETPTEGGFANA